MNKEIVVAEALEGEYIAAGESETTDNDRRNEAFRQAANAQNAALRQAVDAQNAAVQRMQQHQANSGQQFGQQGGMQGLGLGGFNCPFGL